MAKWIRQAVRRPGALRRQLGVPDGEPIPLDTLLWAAQQSGKLGQRARLALQFRKFGSRHTAHRGRYA